MSSVSNAITITNLIKSFGHTRALDGLDLAIRILLGMLRAYSKGNRQKVALIAGLVRLQRRDIGRLCQYSMSKPGRYQAYIVLSE